MATAQVKRVDPDQAASLLAQGYKLVDVRSVPEFEQGHPAGAFNVPLMHREGGGVRPNGEFVEVMQRRFAKGDKLVLSCRSGARSLRAAEQLLGLGYVDVLDMRGGFVGESAPSGQISFPGWQPRELPVSTAAEPGHSYAELARDSS